MRRIFLLSTALLLALASSHSTHAERRPRYGGVLRIEIRGSFDAAEWPVYETLVRYDEHGNIQPMLATSWSHDLLNKRWVFFPRSNVTLHNGEPWQPGLLSYPDDQPIEEILRGLARRSAAIVVKTSEGQSAGTGPFKIAKLDAESKGAGKSVTLAAHESYWGGRPFLDSVEIQTKRSLRDQALDSELGRVDVIDVSPADIRRLRGRGALLSVSRAASTLALICDRACEGLALSIDRAAIHDVILQKQGELTGAIIPQWLSGYAFLFPPQRDLPRAKQLKGDTLTFLYDKDDALMRAVAERVIVNATEAGITLHAAGPAGESRVRLERLAISSTDLQTSIADLAATLDPGASGTTPFDLEQALLASNRIIPLFHLPSVQQLSPRVKSWPKLDDVYVTGDKP